MFMSRGGKSKHGEMTSFPLLDPRLGKCLGYLILSFFLLAFLPKELGITPKILMHHLLLSRISLLIPVGCENTTGKKTCKSQHPLYLPVSYVKKKGSQFLF